MTPERYRQIGELYHAALELDADERSAFLAGSCSGDEELQREVESLLSSHEGAKDFISAPALAFAAEMLADDEADALVGLTIGRYRVLSLIGRGGMGRVYLAEDTALGRRVALKLLPDYFTHDKTQVQRFRQEARAASALNHPNILTVYEVGRVDETEFIVAEYVEGETLRDRATRASVNMREALDIAAQVADALAAAHGAGIVHRDIKPENVMLRPDGYVKVLDFGLAKLTENLSAPRMDERGGSMVRTNPGMVMGTVQYMSPEQARGLSVDARTDLWSLGVILYEMIEHRPPFAGASYSDTLVCILEREPVLPQLPSAVKDIVQRALAKDLKQRYQTANDMASDLKRVRRRLELDDELGRASFPEGERFEASGSQARVPSAGDQVVARGSDVGPVAGTSSLEFAVGEIKRHKAGVALASVLLIAAFAGLSFGLYKLFLRAQSGRSAASAAVPFQTIKMTRLTTSGKVKDAAISLDGKYVVYAKEEEKQQSLWVRQVATGSSVPIVPRADVGYWGLTFSNDGNYVYYVKNEKGGGPFNKLYQVPALGGTSKELMKQVDSAVTFSPDGRRLAFVRDNLKKEETEVVIANADGSREQTLARRKAPERFASDLTTRIAWSPDGKTIACAASSADAGGYYHTVVGISVEGGSEKPLSSQRWGSVAQVTWQSDGRGLLMIATAEGQGQQVIPAQVWHLSYPGGEARRITTDLNRYRDVSLTADASALVTVQTNRVLNIWVAPQSDLSRIKQITSGTLDGSFGLTWTPDGRIVYQSETSGQPEIWMMDADGSNQRQLTHDELRSERPEVSPDGRHIVYASARAGRTNIWLIDADGSNPKQLTNGKSNAHPHFSPDGRWVVYASQDQGNATVWRIPVDGGQPVQLSAPTTNLPVVSPDGKKIACFYWDEQANPPRGAMIFPFAGGAPIRRFNISPSSDGFVLHWTPDSHAILYIGDNLTNIWSQPVDGGEPMQLTDFRGDQVFNFDYSPDGQWLAVARGMATDDVVLISDLK